MGDAGRVKMAWMRVRKSGVGECISGVKKWISSGSEWRHVRNRGCRVIKKLLRSYALSYAREFGARSAKKSEKR